MSWNTARVNRIYIKEPFQPSQIEELAAFINRSGIERISLLGWSLGGFVACDFAARYPHLADTLILVGVRRKYEAAQINSTKNAILSNAAPFLQGFYRQCFLPTQKRDWTRFKSQLMNDYLTPAYIAPLMAGLDYLADATIDKEALEGVRCLIVHGEQDIVAHHGDASQLAHAVGATHYILKGSSHAAFLHDDFAGILEQWLTRQ